MVEILGPDTGADLTPEQRAFNEAQKAMASKYDLARYKAWGLPPDGNVQLVNVIRRSGDKNVLPRKLKAQNAFRRAMARLTGAQHIPIWTVSDIGISQMRIQPRLSHILTATPKL